MSDLVFIALPCAQNCNKTGRKAASAPQRHGAAFAKRIASA